MQIDYVGRGIQLNDEIKAYAEGLLRRADRFLEDPVEVRVTLDKEGHRVVAEVHVHHRFGVLQAEEDSGDLRDAIHNAVEKIEKQARRGRKKFMDQRRRGDRQRAHEWPVDVLERESLAADATPRIVKSSALNIKPMSLEDAALALESAKNDFLVFRDAQHGQVNVLYKRRDGNYGLVSPEA